MVRKYEDLHIAMLTFTGSSKNATGGWRCPADHLRDVISSWRPEDSSGVYHALRYSMDQLGHDWEYAAVVEHHRSGYGHVHVAVFVDGEVDETDFYSAIDAHLRECAIASVDAHDYHSTNPQDRPISVNRVDVDLDATDQELEELGAVTNIGSYIGSYIGCYGEELFDRDLSELIFRCAIWATGSQMVRFSTGANEMISTEIGRRDSEEKAQPKLQLKDSDEDCSGELSEGSPWEIEQGVWDLAGVGRVDHDGESLLHVGEGIVEYREIIDNSHLDPPPTIPFSRPMITTDERSLNDFS